MPPKSKKQTIKQSQAQAQAQIVQQKVVVNVEKPKRKRRTTRKKKAPQPSAYDLAHPVAVYNPIGPSHPDNFGAMYRELMGTIQNITMLRNQKTADQIQAPIVTTQPTALQTIQQRAEAVGQVAETVGQIGQAVGQVAEGAQKGVEAYRAVIPTDTPFEGQTPTLPPRQTPISTNAPPITAPAPQPTTQPITTSPLEPIPIDQISNSQLNNIIDDSPEIPRGAKSRYKRMRKRDKYNVLKELGLL